MMIKRYMMHQFFNVFRLKKIIDCLNGSMNILVGRLLTMKSYPDEKRIAKKSDLKKMKKEILKQDRQEDDKKYVKKSSKRKK